MLDVWRSRLARVVGKGQPVEAAAEGQDLIVGAGPWFERHGGEGPFSVPAHIAGPPTDLVTMGQESYAHPIVHWSWGDTGRVRIGAYCSIHTTVNVFAGGEHRMDWVTTYAIREAFGLPGRFESGHPRARGDVVIGNDVYIGYGTTILSGVTIGDGAVIAACSVVTKDVEPYSIVGGNPGKHIRFRMDQAERAAMQRVRWWEWPREKVVAEVDGLCGATVSAFLARHDEEYARARGGSA